MASTHSSSTLVAERGSVALTATEQLEIDLFGDDILDFELDVTPIESDQILSRISNSNSNSISSSVKPISNLNSNSNSNSNSKPSTNSKARGSNTTTGLYMVREPHYFSTKKPANYDNWKTFKIPKRTNQPIHPIDSTIVRSLNKPSTSANLSVERSAHQSNKPVNSINKNQPINRKPIHRPSNHSINSNQSNQKRSVHQRISPPVIKKQFNTISTQTDPEPPCKCKRQNQKRNKRKAEEAKKAVQFAKRHKEEFNVFKNIEWHYGHDNELN